MEWLPQGGEALVVRQLRLVVQQYSRVLYRSTKIKRTISAVQFATMCFISTLISLIWPDISDLLVPPQVPLEVGFIHELLSALWAVDRRAIVATPKFKPSVKFCKCHHTSGMRLKKECSSPFSYWLLRSNAATITDLMCAVHDCLCTNPTPHSSHSCGFLPACIITWFFHFCFIRNLFTFNREVEV